MIEYDRIDISQGIDVDMLNKSQECTPSLLVFFR